MPPIAILGIDEVSAGYTAIADTNPLRGDLHKLEIVGLSKFHSLPSLIYTGLSKF